MDTELRQYLDAKFGAIDARFDAIDTRFVDTRFDAIDTKFREFETRLVEGLDGLFDAFERRMKDYISASGRELATRITAEFYRDGPYPERRAYLPPPIPPRYT